MKRLLILAIALTFCLMICVCIYMLSAARVPVVTFSPSNEVEVCTLYPLCIKKTGTGIFICPDALNMGGPCEPTERPRPTRAAMPRPTSAATPMPLSTLVRQADTPMPIPTTTARIWQPPSTYTPTPLCSPTPTPTPSCDLTVYLRGTNNAEGFAAFSGEHVNAGSIYTEGGYVYGEVAVWIGDEVYHYPEEEDIPTAIVLGLLGDRRLVVKFSDSLLAVTKGVEPNFDHHLRFWAGILDCNSATDEPYKIEVTLYQEKVVQKHTEISFLVADNPLCGVEGEEPGEVVSAHRYPAPGLVGPLDGDNFKPDETILLIWDTSTPLAEDEWYEVQLWKEEEVPFAVVQRTKEGTWKVEPKYYPGRYQWRILIVRSQGNQKEILSPPSDTRRFSWLRPSVPVSTAPTSPPIVDLTVYLRDTNNAQGFAAFSGEHVDAGAIYSEGSTVYGDVAVRIGDVVYHFDKPKPAPGEPEQLPAPYRLEVKFSESLTSVTGDKAGFNPQKAQFWVGTLDDASATGEDKPYSLTIKLYEGHELRESLEVFFTVVEDVSEECGDPCPGPPPRPPPP